MRSSKNNALFCKDTGLSTRTRCIITVIVSTLALIFFWVLGNAWWPQPAAATPQAEESSLHYLRFRPNEDSVSPENAAEADISDVSFAITKGGEYLLTGSRDATLRIDAPGDTVHLFLRNASIESTLGPAIECARAEKLIITVLPDTENILADSGFYDLQKELVACVDAQCDLVLNGTGKLTVTGLYKDGLRSSDRLRLRDLELDIRCKRSGLHGSDGIAAENMTLTIAAEKNGLRTTKKGADGRGCIRMDGCKVSVTAGRYSFLAEQGSTYLTDCELYTRSILKDFGGSGGVFIQEGGLPQ